RGRSRHPHAHWRNQLSRRCPYDERVTPIDALAIVGEVLSWIGLGIGLPLLMVALMIARVEGRWERVDMVVIEHDDTTLVRWFAGGDFHERALAPREQTSGEW